MKMKKVFVWDDYPVERSNGNSSLAYGQVFSCLYENIFS